MVTKSLLETKAWRARDPLWFVRYSLTVLSASTFSVLFSLYCCNLMKRPRLGETQHTGRWFQYMREGRKKRGRCARQSFRSFTYSTFESVYECKACVQKNNNDNRQGENGRLKRRARSGGSVGFVYLEQRLDAIELILPQLDLFV